MVWILGPVREMGPSPYIILFSSYYVSRRRPTYRRRPGTWWRVVISFLSLSAPEWSLLRIFNNNNNVWTWSGSLSLSFVSTREPDMTLLLLFVRRWERQSPVNKEMIENKDFRKWLPFPPSILHSFVFPSVTLAASFSRDQLLRWEIKA